MKNLSSFDWITIVILFIGGLNWGLVGLFNFNLVGFLFGSMSIISRIIYILVGFSAIYVFVSAFNWGKIKMQEMAR